jgi:hypothetical protein
MKGLATERVNNKITKKGHSTLGTINLQCEEEEEEEEELGGGEAGKA